MAISGSCAHGVVVGGILGFQLDGLLERIARFRHEIQVDADHPKIVVDRGVVWLEVPCVGQVAQRALIIFLLVSYARKLQEQWNGKSFFRDGFLQRGSSLRELASSFIGQSESMLHS